MLDPGHRQKQSKTRVTTANESIVDWYTNEDHLLVDFDHIILLNTSIIILISVMFSIKIFFLYMFLSVSMLYSFLITFCVIVSCFVFNINFSEFNCIYYS